LLFRSLGNLKMSIHNISIILEGVENKYYKGL
jgi:hypothetical protein